MSDEFWKLLREHDPAANSKSIDLYRIAEGLSRQPAAKAKSWTKAVTASAPKSAAASGLVDYSGVADRLRLILTLRTKQETQPRANDLLEELLVEWVLRRTFEGWSGLRVGRFDPSDNEWEISAARVAAKLGTLGVACPEAELQFVAKRLAAWNEALSLSRTPGDSRRTNLLSGLKGGKAEYRFYNPCRPIHVAVTKYPQRDISPEAPSRAWRNPVRVLDAHLDTDPDKPVLLLIHGHGSLAEEYEELIDALRKLPTTKRVRILVPDLPGYGYSDAANLGELSTATYLGFLQQLLTQLKIKKYVPAGGSLGGNLTMQLLASGDSRIKAGVAWSVVSWSERYRGMVDLGNLARVGRELGPDIFWAVYQHQKAYWYPNWKPTLAQRALRDSDVYRREVESEEYRRADWDLIIDQCENVHLDKVERVNKPVLLLAGKNDFSPMQVYPSMKTLHGRLIAQLGVAKAQFFDAFKYGDHSLATEEPELVAKKVADWYGQWA